MTKRLISFILCAMLSLSATAQKGKNLSAVFTLTTYDAQGNTIATTHGVHFGQTGEAIAAWQPFVGAYSASITDASGRAIPVESIIGANETYDVCRFRLVTPAGGFKTTPLQAATSNFLPKGYTVKSVEQFLDTYNYYILNEEIIDEENVGKPILNSAGELLGLIQRAGNSYNIHSTDARYYAALSTTGLGLYDATLVRTKLRLALPDDKDKAFVYLLTIDAATDSLIATNACTEYIKRYPNELEGYTRLADYEALHGNYTRAGNILRYAQQHADDKAKAQEAYDALQQFIQAQDKLAQAVSKHEQGELREALRDYNAYDSLMQYRANDTFYYTRAHCELQLRQYQQAMNDLAHAAVLNPAELTYLAELAALQLRVKQYAEAVQTCEIALARSNDYPDLFIVYALALRQLERNDESVIAMRRALALGDPRAETYLEAWE